MVQLLVSNLELSATSAPVLDWSEVRDALLAAD